MYQNTLESLLLSLDEKDDENDDAKYVPSKQEDESNVWPPWPWPPWGDDDDGKGKKKGKKARAKEGAEAIVEIEKRIANASLDL